MMRLHANFGKLDFLLIASEVHVSSVQNGCSGVCSYIIAQIRDQRGLCLPQTENACSELAMSSLFRAD